MTSAWGAPAGAWANAVEEEEERHGAIQAPVVKETEFPSLGAAMSVKETKKEKKKKQTMSLGEFVSGGAGGAPRADLLMSLPTGPRGRREEGEEEKPLGGAFKGYGGQGRPRYGEDRPPRRPREEEMVSRADAVDDWGSQRKFEPSRPAQGFGGSFREERPPRDRDEPARADLVDDWGASKQPLSSPRGHRDAYADRRGPIRGGRRDTSHERVSRADVEERWGHRGDVKPTAFDDRPRRGFNDSWRDRDGPISSDSTSRDGSADGWKRAPAEERRERPKLNLKPRTRPVTTNAPEKAEEGARASIFGDARPREEVLEERPTSINGEEEQEKSIEEKVEQLKVSE